MTAAAFITSDGETRGCASGISLSVPQDNRILFYQRDRWEFGFLSHFYPSRMTIDGVDWPTVEHYYQSHKSLDRRYFLAIRACETPGLAKRRAATPVPGKKDRGCNCSPLGFVFCLDTVTSAPIHAVGWIVTSWLPLRATTLST